jgi:hypothetical protein
MRLVGFQDKTDISHAGQCDQWGYPFEAPNSASWRRCSITAADIPFDSRRRRGRAWTPVPSNNLSPTSRTVLTDGKTQLSGNGSSITLASNPAAAGTAQPSQPAGRRRQHTGYVLISMASTARCCRPPVVPAGQRRRAGRQGAQRIASPALLLNSGRFAHLVCGRLRCATQYDHRTGVRPGHRLPPVGRTMEWSVSGQRT